MKCRTYLEPGESAQVGAVLDADIGRSAAGRSVNVLGRLGYRRRRHSASVYPHSSRQSNPRSSGTLVFERFSSFFLSESYVAPPSILTRDELRALIGLLTIPGLVTEDVQIKRGQKKLVTFRPAAAFGLSNFWRFSISRCSFRSRRY